MDLDSYSVDDKLSVEGKWVPISATAKLRIARLNNEPYREFIRKKLKPYKSAMRAGSLDDSLMTEVVIQAMARHILLDWEGLKESGAELKYSLETCERILRDKEQFRELVAALANDADLFREAEIEDGVKN